MMRRLLALSLLLASSALAESQAAQYDSLSADQIQDTEYVKKWLARKDLKIDHASIKFLNEQAEKREKTQYWDAAAKSYGEAMLLYPSPEAILNYTNAQYKMLKRIRERDSNPEQKKFSDMSRFLHRYRSAMAADEVLHTLTDNQRNALKTDIDCLEKYTGTKQFQPGCDPLIGYGITK